MELKEKRRKKKRKRKDKYSKGSSEKAVLEGNLECPAFGGAKMNYLLLNRLKVKLSALGGYTPVILSKNLTLSRGIKIR